MRGLARQSRIPIVADESCRVSADLPALVGLVNFVNIKLVKCGSLREALRMIHTARAHRLEVMLGCMLESTLGISAAVQLAPLVDYVDLDGRPCSRTTHSPVRGWPDWKVRLNQTPGLGVSVREILEEGLNGS